MLFGYPILSKDWFKAVGGCIFGEEIDGLGFNRAGQAVPIATFQPTWMEREHLYALAWETK